MITASRSNSQVATAYSNIFFYFLIHQVFTFYLGSLTFFTAFALTGLLSVSGGISVKSVSADSAKVPQCNMTVYLTVLAVGFNLRVLQPPLVTVHMFLACLQVSRAG